VIRSTTRPSGFPAIKAALIEPIETSDPVGLYACLCERFINFDLIGPRAHRTLQH
jgi:hypothetical protein